MSYVVPHEGTVQILTDLMGGGTLENWTLKLYNSNITPAETDTASTYSTHETTFTGYSAKTLTRSVGPTTWNTPASQAPSGSPAWSARTEVGHTQYGSAAQSWTCSGTGDTVYGYYIVGATSGKLIMAEKFAAARTLANGDSISVTPIFEAG